MHLVDGRVVFVHVPRTGGQLTRKILGDCFEVSWFTPEKREVGYFLAKQFGATPVKNRPVPHDYPTAQLNHRVVSTVRNPYSWYVSFHLRFLGGEMTRSSFEGNLPHIPSYGKMVEKMHLHAGIIMRHDRLLFDISRVFGIPPRHMGFLNSRLHHKNYTALYTQETIEHVHAHSEWVFLHHHFEFGRV